MSVDLASSRHVYQSTTIMKQFNNQLLLSARTVVSKEEKKNKKIKVILFATRLSTEMDKRLKQLDPKVAYPIYDDPVFLKLIEAPFVGQVPIKQYLNVYYFMAVESSGKLMADSLGFTPTNVNYIIKTVKILLHLHNKYAFAHGELTLWHIYVSKEGEEADVKLIPPRSVVIRRMEMKECCPYRCPDFHQGREVTELSDIYSLGLILADVVRGQTMEDHKPQSVVQSIKFKRLASLVQRMLCSYECRMTLSELLGQLQEIYDQLTNGVTFRIPLLGTFIKDQQLSGCLQKRIVLNGFLLSLQYNSQYAYLIIRLLFKQSLKQFISVRFNSIRQMPEDIVKRWLSLKQLTEELLRHRRDTMRFMTDGFLAFTSQDQDFQ